MSNPAQEDRAQFPTLTLTRSLIGFVVVTVFLIGLSVLWMLYARSAQMIDSALESAVRLRTNAAGESFARTIHADWLNVKYLAATAATEPPETLGAMLDGVRGEGRQVSWVGYADLDGTVLSASGGLLVGADVSQRPWFRNGLRSGFAGDVHDAVLLAQKLQPQGGEPLRFVDLALPVISPLGETVGVVGMHIDANWAAATLTESGHTLGIDVFLMNPSGQVVMSSSEGEPNPAELSLLREARIGSESAGRETWPDGKQYFSALVPEVTYGDMPSFGWRLAGRLPASAFRSELTSLVVPALIFCLATLAILGAMTFLYWRIFIMPLKDLIDSADRIARGAEEYPSESQSTREVALLSAALSRLQTRDTHQWNREQTAPRRAAGRG